MTESNLKAGDIVKLKSGGPNMSIESTHDDGAHCVWFKELELKREYIRILALVKVGTPTDKPSLSELGAKLA